MSACWRRTTLVLAPLFKRPVTPACAQALDQAKTTLHRSEAQLRSYKEMGTGREAVCRFRCSGCLIHTLCMLRCACRGIHSPCRAARGQAVDHEGTTAVSSLPHNRKPRCVSIPNFCVFSHSLTGGSGCGCAVTTAAVGTCARRNVVNRAR